MQDTFLIYDKLELLQTYAEQPLLLNHMYAPTRPPGQDVHPSKDGMQEAHMRPSQQ